VQNGYSLVNRTVENALDETLHRLDVALLAYSPLAFGLLTGKYDAQGLTGAGVSAQARLKKFESTRKQRWGRPLALDAARRYNQLAREHGMTPVQMALAFCYTQWRVASTLIGVTSVAQLDECVDAYGTSLPAELLAQIDVVRWEMRDPAQ
jgi:aryl-alcohol dehydrogenase-like predicted oxidoreductase